MSPPPPPDPSPDPAPDSGQFRGRIHILPIRVYYEDTDLSGMVYHANYVRYCERGRSAFLRAAGLAHHSLLARAEPLLFAVTRISLDYRRAARLDDALAVHTGYDRVKGPRLFITQSVRRAGEILAQAAVEACCISADGRAIRPPADFVAALSPFFA